jgi:hypothetical protein
MPIDLFTAVDTKYEPDLAARPTLNNGQEPPRRAKSSAAQKRLEVGHDLP